MKPTIVLVHGAFAESASWNGVISRLRAAGHRVIAAANPLRSLSGDAAAVRSLLTSIEGPIVLVGHSYGGAVITNAAIGLGNVKALVYAAGLAPDKGESVPDLTGKYPGATLGEVLYQVPFPDGTTDAYIEQSGYHRHFAADLSPEQATVAAATQRPFNSAAAGEGSGEPAWRTIPSWFIYPELDLAIPAEVFRFMAERAGARATVEVPGASHALPVSQPQAVADFILRAVANI
ncbi:alpha/beta hydrolase [Spongiactinospora sp. TRM90649]|uniref:alpha/beta fold hydrolase n=1 Tax=Spongiactinospora sp. TRM90649 TaxID=3031114 RepID=UPI0023F623E6|nr:alpha/beta hydrolase [Spongiactinospora sp. TRM90649]MDF5758044.1 alpha/beta hydrolase [Spongiactinospora sp. TRM90649]